MTYRITKAMLQKQLETACGFMGKSTDPIMGRDQDTGSIVWNVGAWSLDHNSHYGGIRIEEVVNDGGATREVTQRMSNKEMLEFLRGLIYGITYTKEG